MLFNITDLNYSVDGQSILSNYGLNVEAGKHLLLLGQSGCGKTTLMNLMAGLLRPNSGQVVFDGQNYAALSENRLDSLRAENFGFVFQRLHLINHLTVMQNILLTQTKPNPQYVKELISDLGLGGKEHRKARDLSVGEAQRAAIARAVANSPKVIFADEPTSALDDNNTDRVMEMLFAQAKKTGATVIAATHDDRIKGRFDDVLEMTA